MGGAWTRIDQFPPQELAAAISAQRALLDRFDKDVNALQVCGLIFVVCSLIFHPRPSPIPRMLSTSRRFEATSSREWRRSSRMCRRGEFLFVWESVGYLSQFCTKKKKIKKKKMSTVIMSFNESVNRRTGAAVQCDLSQRRRTRLGDGCLFGPRGETGCDACCASGRGRATETR